MNKPNHRRYTNHGHLLKKTKPPIAKGTAIPFLFDGIQMTGFKTPVDDTRRMRGTNMTGLATPTKEQTQLEEYAPSTMSSSSSCVSYAPTSKSPTTPTTPTTRNTYLSNFQTDVGVGNAMQVAIRNGTDQLIKQTSGKHDGQTTTTGDQHA